MNRTSLPTPPNPATYSNNLTGWQQAVYQWMLNVKTQIETDSTANIAPVGPFRVGSYTNVSTVTGTDDLSNFVATLVTAMNNKGLTSPTSQRLSNS